MHSSRAHRSVRLTDVFGRHSTGSRTAGPSPAQSGPPTASPTDNGFAAIARGLRAHQRCTCPTLACTSRATVLSDRGRALRIRVRFPVLRKCCRSPCLRRSSRKDSSSRRASGASTAPRGRFAEAERAHPQQRMKYVSREGAGVIAEPGERLRPRREVCAKEEQAHCAHVGNKPVREDCSPRPRKGVSGAWDSKRIRAEEQARA